MRPDNDIVLKENDITGILDNAFHIRVYKNGNAAAVVKVLDEKDKISLAGNLEVIPRITARASSEKTTTEKTTTEKTTGFEIVLAIAMLLGVHMVGGTKKS